LQNSMKAGNFTEPGVVLDCCEGADGDGTTTGAEFTGGALAGTVAAVAVAAAAGFKADPPNAALR